VPAAKRVKFSGAVLKSQEVLTPWARLLVDGRSFYVIAKTR